MLIQSMWLLGSALTAIALAADWYIWDPRYRRISGAWEPRPGHRTRTNGKDLIYAPSASGREVVATFTAPSVPGGVLAQGKVQGQWTDHRAEV
jgi:hypothetical protein